MKYPGSPRERRSAEMKKYLTGALLLMGFLVLFSGCSGQGVYRVLPPVSGNVTIQTLLEHWQDYDVYFAGLDVGVPSAVMFHPKNDDRLITVDRWSKVESRKLLADLIDSIQRQTGFYYPKLLEIRGPDGHLYGFIFTAWDVVLTKMIGDRNMFVFDIPLPPDLAIGAGHGDHGPRTP
jgi:hypothetical protein